MIRNTFRDTVLLGVNLAGTAAWVYLAAKAVSAGQMGLAAVFVGVCSICVLSAIGALFRLLVE